MAESRNLLLLLVGIAGLFVWSVWAGLAGLAAVGSWMLWLVAQESSKRRGLQRRCREQIEQALAARNVKVQALFSSFLGVNAIGLGADRRTIVCVSPDSAETFDIGVILEGRVQRLPQGDYEIGICVPGRVSGKPHGLYGPTLDLQFGEQFLLELQYRL